MKISALSGSGEGGNGNIEVVVVGAGRWKNGLQYETCESDERVVGRETHRALHNCLPVESKNCGRSSERNRWHLL